MLLLIPMLKVLHRRYGQPCEVVSSGRWTAPLMQRVPSCGSLRLLTSRRAPYWFNRSQWEFVAALRQRPAGPVYIYEPDEKSHSLLQRGGISAEWICSLRNLPRQPDESIQDHALRLARETPIALQNSVAFPVDPDYTPDARPVLSEADRRDCENWLTSRNLGATPLVLLQPGNKKTMRRGSRTRSSNIDYWPEHHWARVIEGVRQQKPEAQVVICGSPEERSLADDVVSQVQGPKTRIIIATDDLPIPRLLTLQARSHSMISVNTGPAHGAAAMGCPLVVLFNRHEHRAPGLYAPQSTTAPVKILLPDSLNPEANLSSIQPESVLAAWREMSAALPG
jgi:heptosyltransferase-2/heptosyltransferase-3